jgi:hypothetical protein
LRTNTGPEQPDSAKEETPVDLYESVIPIPIVRGDNVRVIGKNAEQ